MLRRMRVHSNFAEYVPFAIVLMGLCESLGTAAWLLHVSGVVLVVARVVHAVGVSEPKENFRLRVIGIGGTLTVIGALAIIAIIKSVMQLA